MTEVISRPPLNALSMSAAQGERRRSARLAFDEEETRPAKRARTEDSQVGKSAKQANGRKSTVPPKKSKASYDEDDDGFQFSRGKSKKHPSKQPSIPPPIREEPPPPSQDPQPKPSTTQGKRGRPRKESLDTQPQLQPQLEPKKTPAKRRKSARLSGDQEQARPGERAPSEQHARSEIEDGRVAKTPSSGPLHVDKKRGPTKIALPFADTPVIMRNKQMRKDSSEGRRRSSSGMRGRRASSLIDSGTSNGKIKHQHEMIGGMEAETYIAMPHDEVATGDFYKHIHQDLSEPRRMKQLLVWCGTRALPPRPTGGKEDVNAVLAARTIQDEILRDFSNKNEMSDWFNREDLVPTALVKKPNPRNLQNAAKLQELEQEVKRLNAEKSAWDAVLGSLASTQTKCPSSEDLDPTRPPAATQVDEKVLDQPEQHALLSDLQKQAGSTEDAQSRLGTATKALEFRVDSFADGIHKLDKLRESGDTTTDRILSQAAAMLQQRDEAASSSAGTEKVGIGDLLRSLSRAS